MSPPEKPATSGFTLVEIAMAVGIFAFAILGVVFLLGTGLRSSAEVRRDSALSSALMTSSALLRAPAAAPASLTLLFDDSGSQVTDPKKAIYEFVIATSAIAPPNMTNVNLYTVQVNSPYPKKIPVGEFILSRPKP